jgi:hypothetical protein
MAQGRMFVLRHKRKIARLTVDLAHMYVVCTEIRNSGRRLITKYGRQSKQKQQKL